MALGYSVNFGPEKKGLSTVQRAWFDNTFSIIGSWDPVSEIEPDSGIYYIFETPPLGIYWLAWKTGEGDATELYLLNGVDPFALVFNMGKINSGKTLKYSFLDSSLSVLSEVTTDIYEVAGTGAYYARNVIVPNGTEFILVETVEANPVFAGGAFAYPTIKNYQVPKDGPYTEEKPI